MVVQTGYLTFIPTCNYPTVAHRLRCWCTARWPPGSGSCTGASRTRSPSRTSSTRPCPAPTPRLKTLPTPLWTLSCNSGRWALNRISLSTLDGWNEWNLRLTGSFSFFTHLWLNFFAVLLRAAMSNRSSYENKYSVSKRLVGFLVNPLTRSALKTFLTQRCQSSTSSFLLYRHCHAHVMPACQAIRIDGL